jgi:hypothetical protein
VASNPALDRLRQLVARRKQLTAEIDQTTEAVLREGAFVNDVADALGESRETVRRFRKDRGIPDAREIRRAMGGPARRS